MSIDRSSADNCCAAAGPAGPLTRRALLARSGMGFASLALAPWLPEVQAAATAGAGSTLNPLAPKPSHFPARAKHVIHLFMNGGPSQVDTFDPKPALAKYAGQELPTGNLQTEPQDRSRVPLAFQISKARSKRDRSQRTVFARRPTHRRHRRDSIDDGRHPEP